MPSVIPPLSPRRGGLPLPLLAPDVPGSLALRSSYVRDGGGSVVTAEALLKTGLLQERDWCGQFDKTIEAGLKRWVNREMGCLRLKVFGPLGLVVTDDIEDYLEDDGDINTEYWHENNNGNPYAPLGMFALNWGNHMAQCVYVAGRTMRLERAMRGLGFGMLHLIEIAFWAIGSGQGFRSVLNEVEEGVENWGYEEAEEEDTFMTPARMFELIPEETTLVDWDATLAERAKHSVALNLRRPIELALALDEQLSEMVTRFGYSSDIILLCNYNGNLAPHPVVYMAWCENDFTHRVLDEQAQYHMEDDTLTSIAWCHGYQIGHTGRQFRAVERRGPRGLTKRPGSAPVDDLDGRPQDAALALKMVIGIIKTLDELLHWLNGDPAKKKPRARFATRQTRLVEMVATGQF